MDRTALAELLAHLESDIRALVGLIDFVEEYTSKVNLKVEYQEMLGNA